jgi:hypothetical protein
MNDDEEKLLEGFRRLSPSNRYIALAQIIAGAGFEESARRQYGINRGTEAVACQKQEAV